MELTFYYGPDKLPFWPEDLEQAQVSTPRPFHGIISRGLLEKAAEIKLDPETWHRYAHLLDSTQTGEPEPDLSQLQEYAWECQVLSFGQSALCAKEYLERYCQTQSKEISRRLKTGKISAELWNIKEGHTSSVWKATLTGSSHSPPAIFIINVARDREAGTELKSCSGKMRAICRKCPQVNLAKVYDITELYLDYGGKPTQVVVTRNEWIGGAYEIHPVFDQETRQARYVLVERFLTSQNNPAQISSIKGRAFSETECRKIESDVAFFIENASKAAPAQINFNEGDVVWSGTKAVVVAIS